MTLAQRQFKSLSAEATRALSVPYFKALTKIVMGENPEDAWRSFRRIFIKAWILSDLIGRADVLNQLRASGFRIDTDQPKVKPSDVEQFKELEPILVGPFTAAINQFRNRVPRLRQVVDGLTQQAKSVAFFITGVENKETLVRIKAMMAKQLEGDEIIPIAEFVDFARNQALTNLTAARLENVYRTNMQTALNAGTAAQLNDTGVKSATALWMLDEIQDRRTRGNPSGLYPNAGPHFQMDGFIEVPGHDVWNIIWPPNGYQCRARVTPISWFTARARGLATADNRVNQDAVDAANGARWGLINSGQYPDEGFAGGPALTTRVV